MGHFPWLHISPSNHIWLVVSIPLKHISQWERLSHILWKTKNVWNHQPNIINWHIRRFIFPTHPSPKNVRERSDRCGLQWDPRRRRPVWRELPALCIRKPVDGGRAWIFPRDESEMGHFLSRKMGISSVWSPCIGVWKKWGTYSKSLRFWMSFMSPLWDEPLSSLYIAFLIGCPTWMVTITNILGSISSIWKNHQPTVV